MEIKGTMEAQRCYRIIILHTDTIWCPNMQVLVLFFEMEKIQRNIYNFNFLEEKYSSGKELGSHEHKIAVNLLQ